MIVATILRGLADRLDPPPPLPPRPVVDDDDDDRQTAALGLLDPEVVAWVLCEVRRNGPVSDVVLKGNVPPMLWLHIASTLRRVADAASL